MKSKDPNNQTPEISTLSLIQKLKAGLLDPKILPKEHRQQCVEIFIGEGYTISTIAHILKRSDKTIQRDLKEIKERNSITPNIDLARQIIGEVIFNAKSHHSYLVRLSRLQEASVAEKAQAIFLAWRVQKEFVERLQTLGYLPSMPGKVVGKFSYQLEKNSQNIPEDMPEELKAMIEEAKKLSPRERETFRENLEKKFLDMYGKDDK